MINKCHDTEMIPKLIHTNHDTSEADIHALKQRQSYRLTLELF